MLPISRDFDKGRLIKYSYSETLSPNKTDRALPMLNTVVVKLLSRCRL